MIPFVQFLAHRQIQPFVRFTHECPANHLPPRFIHDHELLFISSGHGHIESLGQRCSYKEGTVILIPPGVEHQMEQYSTKERHIAIHFDWEQRFETQDDLFSIVDGEESGLLRPQPSIWVNGIVVMQSASKALFAWAAETLRVFSERKMYWQLRVQAAMLQLIIQLADDLASGIYPVALLNTSDQRQSMAHREKASLLKLVEQINQLLHADPVCPAAFEAALKSVHFSESHLRRLFKEQMGLTPLAYFTSLRLRKAATLLVESQLPIQEIAHRCGYEDSKYFSRLFRQHEGMNPMEYRLSLSRQAEPN